MPEIDNRGWRNYQPNKGTLVWSTLGGVAATLIVGFAALGWYTAEGAQSLAKNAAEEAQAELASAICVERFMTGQDVSARLVELKDESSWKRDDYIEAGGWATFAGFEKPVKGAFDLCAETLVKMDAPAMENSASTNG